MLMRVKDNLAVPAVPPPPSLPPPPLSLAVAVHAQLCSEYVSASSSSSELNSASAACVAARFLRPLAA
eukprot:1892740-Pleurochrysis_carterae.AAC.1